MWKLYNSVYQKQAKHPKYMEQHLQYVVQKVHYNANSYTFAAHFDHNLK